ncbi:MAG: hypothetical protein J7L73_05440 [Anaerolineales bacterium]|nr:hypothetical protein [Anaerolineales bacterium]HEY61215.1 hypothetical protein [Anaerolineae bacterium]
MSTIISIPIFIGLVILQTSIINQMPLLQGTPDISMLVLIAWSLLSKDNSAWFWGLFSAILIGFVSTLPLLVYLISYLSIVEITLITKRQVWQKPYFTMIIITFVGTILTHFLSYLMINLTHSTLPLMDTINLITLPSLLLNLLLSIPIYALIQDVSETIFPTELES